MLHYYNVSENCDISDAMPGRGNKIPPLSFYLDLEFCSCLSTTS